MADTRIVDLIYVEVNGVERDEVQEVTVGVANPKTAVKTMTRTRRVLGFTAGIPDFSFELTVVEPKAQAGYWENLALTKTPVSIVYEESDSEVAGSGNRYALSGCVVDEVSIKGSTEGNVTKTVSGQAADRKRTK